MMDISPDIRRALQHVFITMQARFFEERYAALVERYRMNCEIVLDHASLDSLSKRTFRRIAHALQRFGVRCTVHAPFQELFPGAPDRIVREASIKRLSAAFDIAALFNPESVVMHLNYEEKRFGFVIGEWLLKTVPDIAHFAQKAKTMGAILAIENVYEEGPGIMEQVLSRLTNQNAFMCLDVGHVSAFSRTPLKTWLSAMNTRIRQFHLHDNNGKGDAHKPIGEGTIDFSLIAKYITRAPTIPLITLEPHSVEDIWRTVDGFCKKGLFAAIVQKKRPHMPGRENSIEK
jgi:sugar phosphate isomerase/epimerase